MRKIVLAFCSLILLLSFLSFLPVVVSQESNGNITFEPNMIPFTTVYERVGKNNDTVGSGERFRFKWLDNTFDIELFFNATYEGETRLFSLRDFENDFNVTVQYVANKNASHCQFGWVVDDVEDISSFVHNAWFKIEDTQPFDYDDIELEEIELFEEGYNITRFHLPDNLVLSFEDLYHKDFVIGHQNKTSTSVKGFSGKSSWNLDPITLSGDVITAIGGTEGSELDFDDLWVADKSGTRELLASTSAGNHTLTTQVKPADNKSIQLGITANELTASGFCNITGTEKDDSVQTENMTISANTTYTTNNYWKTVAYINCSGTWNITVQQGQWGVVWKTSDTQYVFDAKIVLGNGTVEGTTWFADNSKQIVFSEIPFSAEWQIAMHLKAYAHVRFGTLTDASSKFTDRGVDVIVKGGTYNNLYLIAGASDSEIEIYSSHLQVEGIGSKERFLYSIGDGVIYNSILEGLNIIGSGWSDLYNLVIYNGRYNLDNIAPSSIEKIFLYGSWHYTVGDLIKIYDWTSLTVKDVHATVGGSSRLFYCQKIKTNSYIINSESNAWTFYFYGTALENPGKVYRQYTFDLTVTYPNGTAIQNANVTVTHYGQAETQDFTELTDSNGQISQKTLSMGFYNQTGANTIYNYNPFNIEITNATGCQDLNENFTLSAETDWVKALPLNNNPTARYIFSPSDPQTNTAVNFDASDSTDSDGTVSSYAWNFGDGNSDTGSTTSHTYTSAGGYQAMLTVTDDDTATNSFNQTITVTVPQSMVSPAPVLRKTSVKTTFKGPLTYYPSWIELLQQQASITATIQLDNTICTTNITLFYTVENDETKDVVEQGNKTFWIRPDGSETVELQFTAPFTWGKTETSYTLSTYTMFSMTKSDISVYPINIMQGATMNLVRASLIILVLGFLSGLAYYVWRSKPKKERNVLKLPGGSKIEW